MRAFTVLRAGCGAVGRHTLAAGRSHIAIAAAGGAVAGVLIQAAGHQFVAQFGASRPIAAGLALAVGLGLSIAAMRASRSQSAAGDMRPALWSLALLACWTLAFPWLAAAAFAITARVPMEFLATPGIDLCYGVALAVALIAPPVAGALAFADRWSRLIRAASGCSTPLWRSTLAGVAAGILMQVFTLAPLAGVAGGAWIAAAASGLLVVVVLRGKRRGEAPAGADDDANGDLAEEGPPTRISLATYGALGTMIFCLGGSAALFSRGVAQLMPPASYVLWTEWAAVICGVVIGFRWGARRGWVAIRAGLLAACCAAAMPLIFNQMTDWLLALNATVGSVPLLMLVRSGIAAVCFLPIGIAWGAAAESHTEDEERFALNPRPFLFVGGFVACQWILLPRIPGGVLFAACGWALAAASALMALRATQRQPATSDAAPQRPRRWRAAALATGAAAILIAGAAGHRGYDPARSAKSLFTAEAVVAYRNGIEPELRTTLDDARLLAVVEGDGGTLAVWRHGGCQLQVRESGMPKSLACIDDRIAPQPWAEVLHSVIPLALHPRPERVMLLGLGAGTTATTALVFPVAELLCCEPDSAMLALARGELREGFRSKLLAGESAWDDARMRVERIDSKLALAARNEEFDVILSNPDRPLSCSAQGDYAREFYVRAAEKLAEGGIFCQRFSHPDYGSMPVRVVAATLQSVFAHVAIVQVAPGEMLLLATNAEEGFSGTDLGVRLQAPHVRRALAQLDWDWTVPLSFTALEGGLLARFAEADDAGINTAANGRFAFSLPQEVMRWGQKGAELNERLTAVLGPGEHPRQLFDWIAAEERIIARSRWEQVLERQRILDQHPDEWWAYRLSLRRRIQNSRPLEIIQARGGDPIEPTDNDRRVEYLRALGNARRSLSENAGDARGRDEAAGGMTPAAEAAAGLPAVLVELAESASKEETRIAIDSSQPREEIARVAAFGSPYDPLLAHFLHFELAELHRSAREAGDESHAAEELIHRLHAAQFAIVGDRSVRNIAAALELLCGAEAASAEPDPLLRYDYLNGLLQALRRRWDERAARPVQQKAAPALADADACIVAVERALAALDQLAEAGAGENWPARRTYLERILLRPLRTYRSRVHQHHVKSVRHTRRLFDEVR